MVNEDIVTALRNAVNKGEHLEDAVRVMIQSGYNPKEVEEASHFVAGRVSRMLEPKKEEQFLITPKIQSLSQPSSKVNQSNPLIQNQKSYQQLQQLPQLAQQPITKQPQNPVNQSSTQKQTSPQPVQQTQINQVPKEKPKKRSYWIEIILFIILLMLVGILTATIIYKDQILSVLSR